MLVQKDEGNVPPISHSSEQPKPSGVEASVISPPHPRPLEDRERPTIERPLVEKALPTVVRWKYEVLTVDLRPFETRVVEFHISTTSKWSSPIRDLDAFRVKS
jgi:hypothetical protein